MAEKRQGQADVNITDSVFRGLFSDGKSGHHLQHAEHNYSLSLCSSYRVLGSNSFNDGGLESVCETLIQSK